MTPTCNEAGRPLRSLQGRLLPLEGLRTAIAAGDSDSDGGNDGDAEVDRLEPAPAKTPKRQPDHSALPSPARSPGGPVGRVSDAQQGGDALQKQPLSAEGEAEDIGEHATDSEAGLFIRGPADGPAEPLVLWPLAGDEGPSGSSDRPVVVPASINGQLLPHQREGARFLYRLYRAHQGGILGDDMGLGKTVQVIAFLAAVLGKRGDFTDEVVEERKLPPRVSSKKIRANVPNGHEFAKVVLILCPTSVLHNWEKEFRAWGSFRVGLFHGPTRESSLARLLVGEFEVLLTSYDTYLRTQDELLAIGWDCIVADEVHRLKNEKSKIYIACQRFQTRRRYGLSGTVMQNKYLELFNVLHWASPGCLGDRVQFREYYEQPLQQGQRLSVPSYFVEKAEARKEELVSVLKRFMLRRTKDETIGHLMLGKEDNIVFCTMSPLQRQVYHRILGSPDMQLLIQKDEPCSCGSRLTRAECHHQVAEDGILWKHMHKDGQACEQCPFCLILPCLTKLQQVPTTNVAVYVTPTLMPGAEPLPLCQVSNHLELIKANPKDEPGKREKDKEFARMALGEGASLAGGVAPSKSFLGLSDASHCGKMQALELLLTSWTSGGDKILLFSLSVKMLDILDRFLIRRGYSFLRLDGGTPMAARQAMVDEFNSSPSIQVFLMSTRAGGLGLNLASANRVVVFDPNWNPAHDLQAQDRSFRYGQTRHVTVYRLLSAGSLEELVYSRQIYKQQQSNIATVGATEKRYFEGVQDSKIHKGELFGVGNLFQDLSDEVFTADIIEKHEARRLRVVANQAQPAGGGHRRAARASEQEPAGEGVHGSLVEDDDGDAHGLSELARLIQAEAMAARARQGGGEVEDDAQEAAVRSGAGGNTLREELASAGVIYTHRNEQVLGSKSPPRKRGKAEVHSATTKRPPHGGRHHWKQRTPEDADGVVGRSPGASSIGPRSAEALRQGPRHDELSRSTATLVGDSRLSSLGHIAARDDVEARKASQFAEMAAFKGMDLVKFSTFVATLSTEARVALQADFLRSRGR
eukprot:SM000133S26815  [mRNA]  locus=s133:247537:253406:- [translate_table: standard]